MKNHLLLVMTVGVVLLLAIVGLQAPQVQSQGLALAAGAFDLSWHTVSGGGVRAAAGPYSLESAVVQPAGLSTAGDYELQSGFLYGALARPALAGDMDGDCDVDVVDIMLVAAHWGAHSGDALYDPWYDRDNDGDIDIVDIMWVIARWGNSCS
jgi:hypothetical protein